MTVELTVSTVRGAFLLRPTRRLREITVGVLARAQKATGARIHMFTYLSTLLEISVLYRAAAERLRSGDRSVVFPPGTFPPSLPITLGGVRA